MSNVTSMPNLPAPPHTPIVRAENRVSADSPNDSPTPATIMAEAKKRWPHWGPWKITVTHHEDGRVEYELFGRSPVPSSYENRARAAKDLETLARRVTESADG